MSNLLGIDQMASQELEECGTEKVVHVTLINPSFQPSLENALARMIEAKLHIDKFGFSVSNTGAPAFASDEKHLSDKLTILVNDITIAMEKLEYASYRGKVYKKNPKSRYTYTYKCEARAFINSLATNEQFKSRLIRDMRRVIDLLADPNCELFQPLVIDYDLIEVNNGVCWSVKNRAFVENPIEVRQIGKLSPRCFCAHDPATEADPKYFREILENSLSASEVAMFCEDFLRLLNHNAKKHKDKVPCLVGAANSGKTSLFFPIQGLVHHGNIATVTKQRAFNKAMITPFTEVIFIDEADENVLDISDWKILTQGGYTAHDVKYQTAKAFINRCPMLVTAQRNLDFGPTHQPAMDRRLRTYHFKSLPDPKKKAAAWLRKHAMECVVWAAKKTHNREGDTENDTDSDEEDTWQDTEGTLKVEEKEAIRSLSLSSPLVQETAGSNTSDEETLRDSVEEAESADDVLAPLKESLARSHPDSLRYRQLKHMLREAERKRFELRDRAKKQHQARKAALREKGVSTQSAELLPTNPDSAMPSAIQRELQRRHDDQKVHQEQERRETARAAFEGQWLRSTEKELHDCVKFIPTCLDPTMRKSLTAYREVLEDKLKNHHRNLGTLGSSEALKERKRVCVSLGLLQNRHQHLVQSVHEALPTTEELGESSAPEGGHEAACAHEGPGGHTGVHESSAEEVVEDDDDEEEQLMFITPTPSWQTSHTAFERTHKEATSSRKRPRSQRTQSKRAKTRCDNAITRYFLSQQ